MPSCPFCGYDTFDYLNPIKIAEEPILKSAEFEWRLALACAYEDWTRRSLPYDAYDLTCQTPHGPLIMQPGPHTKTTLEKIKHEACTPLGVIYDGRWDKKLRKLTFKQGAQQLLSEAFFEIALFRAAVDTGGKNDTKVYDCRWYDAWKRAHVKRGHPSAQRPHTAAHGMLQVLDLMQQIQNPALTPWLHCEPDADWPSFATIFAHAHPFARVLDRTFNKG